jgi:hypothetical protein
MRFFQGLQGGAALLPGLGLALLGLAAAPMESLGQTLAQGAFSTKDPGSVQAGGGFEIRNEGGKFTLRLGGDFRVSPGPDLFFILHPLPAADIHDNNAETNSLRIDPGLKAFSGAETYDLPASLDLSAYKTLIIHCWSFDHLFAAGTLVKIVPNPVRIPDPGAAAQRLYRGGRFGWAAMAGQQVDAAGRALSRMQARR